MAIEFNDWDRWIREKGADDPYRPYEYGQLWWPLSTGINEWEDEAHKLMLCDRLRMEQYRGAIKQVIDARVAARPGEGHDGVLRILDIGCGTGVLMRMAADAWVAAVQKARKNGWKAVRIYGVERNRMIGLSAQRLLSQQCYPSEGNGARRVLWDFEPRSRSRNEDLAERCAVVLVCRSDQLAFRLRAWKDILKGFDDIDLSGPGRGQDVEGARNGRTGGDVKAQIFDVIVTETIGGLGDDEDIVRILDHAADYLARSGCAFVPRRLESHITPVLLRDADAQPPLADLPPLPSERDQVNEPRSAYWTIQPDKYDFTAIADARNTIWDAVVRNDWILPGLNGSIAAWEWGSGAQRRPPIERRLNYTYHLQFSPPEDKLPRTLVGFKGWFVATLADGVVLDTSGDAPITGARRRTSDCWKHRFLPVDHPIAVKKGSSIELIFSRTDERQLAKYRYRWRGRVYKGRKTLERFDQSFVMRAPETPAARDPAPRPLGRRALDYFVAMCLALLFGLFVDVAIEGFGDRARAETVREWVFARGGLATFVLAGWAVWLLRVAHSAFVLASDQEFHDEFDSRVAPPRGGGDNVQILGPQLERVKAQLKGALVRYAVPVAPFAVFVLSIALLIALTYERSLVWPHTPGVALAYYCCVSGVAMFWWDMGPWSSFKRNMTTWIRDTNGIASRGGWARLFGEAPQFRALVALGYLSPRQMVLQQQFCLWVVMDCVLIVLGGLCVYAVVEGRSVLLGRLEMLVAASLTLLSLLDWAVCREFYKGGAGETSDANVG